MENLSTQEILDKIEMMKQIVCGFTEVLKKENEALKTGDDQTVKVLYEQKIKTVAAYRSLTAFFIKNHQQIKDFNGPDKDDLKNLSVDLDKVLKTNEILLKARMEAGKKVMDTFINIAKAKNNSYATSYGAKGNYSPLDNNRNALAFNRTL